MKKSTLLSGFLAFLMSFQTYSADVFFRENNLSVSLPDYLIFNARFSVDATAASFFSDNLNHSTSSVYVGGVEKCDLCKSKKYITESKAINGMTIEIHEVPRGRVKGVIKVTVFYDSYYFVEIFDDLDTNSIEYWAKRVRKKHLIQ